MLYWSETFNVSKIVLGVEYVQIHLDQSLNWECLFFMLLCGEMQGNYAILYRNHGREIFIITVNFIFRIFFFGFTKEFWNKDLSYNIFW